jgi:hypothetical protein
MNRKVKVGYKLVESCYDCDYVRDHDHDGRGRYGHVHGERVQDGYFDRVHDCHDRVHDCHDRVHDCHDCVHDGHDHDVDDYLE